MDDVDSQLHRADTMSASRHYSSTGGGFDENATTGQPSSSQSRYSNRDTAPDSGACDPTTPTIITEHPNLSDLGPPPAPHSPTGEPEAGLSLRTVNGVRVRVAPWATWNVEYDVCVPAIRGQSSDYVEYEDRVQGPLRASTSYPYPGNEPVELHPSTTPTKRITWLEDHDDCSDISIAHLADAAPNMPANTHDDEAADEVEDPHPSADHGGGTGDYSAAPPLEGIDDGT